MRKYILTLVCALFALCAFATDKKDAVSMVSYEQSWLDDNGTLSLKNNTNEEIHNVVFQITYLNMSGKAIDYEEFSKEISIAPGMTRKLDIPAYERDRDYHYYQSEGTPGGSPAFKIAFELKDYNVAEVTDSTESELSPDAGDMTAYYTIFGLFFLSFLIGAAIGLYVLIAVMAKKRKRNVAFWVLLSIVVTPLWAAIILLIIGEDNSRTDYDQG